MIGSQASTQTAAELPATPRAVKPVRAGWVRHLGNLLIALGLVLMGGVGGYLAYQNYTNDQTTQQINAQHAQAGGIILLPPAPSPAASTSDAASTGNAAPAPAPAAVDDTVRVNEAPLTRLNNGVSLAGLASVAQSKPPVKIEIPRLGIGSPVVPIGWEMIPGKGGQDSSRWKVAEYAAGHHDGTANPGQIGNVVISGHDDWKGEVFKNLHQSQRGDEIHVYTDDREYLYIVQDIQLVKEDGASDEQKRQNARYMDPTPDPTLTLITCYPYGIDDHRLIVIAKPYDSGLPARPDLIVR